MTIQGTQQPMGTPDGNQGERERRALRGFILSLLVHFLVLLCVSLAVLYGTFYFSGSIVTRFGSAVPMGGTASPSDASTSAPEGRGKSGGQPLERPGDESGCGQATGDPDCRAALAP